MYFNREFAQGRLVDTIIRFRDRAALVVSVINEAQDLLLIDMETGDEIEVNIDDKDVNLDPPRVGWVYCPIVGARYFRRPAERRWKQGIPIGLFDNMRGNRELIGKSLNGKFKPFRQCCRAEKTEPFHIHWAVSRGRLIYKGEVVGKVTKEGVPTLNDGCFWLKEYLEEVIL